MAFAAYYDYDHPNVRELQQLLADFGVYTGGITGDFDDDTYQAYRALCREHKRPISRDESGRLIVTLEDFLALEALRPAVEAPVATTVPALVLPKAFTVPEVLEPDAASEEAADPFSNDVPAKHPAAVKGLPAEPRRVVKSRLSAYPYEIATFSDGTCEIIGYKPTYHADKQPKLEIPAQFSGLQVVDILLAVFNRARWLHEVILPDGIVNLRQSTFSECTALTCISLPKSLESIARNAFIFCSALTSIAIPDRVFYIGHSAFEYCESLTSISLPKHLTYIGSSAFSGCKSIVSVSIPSGVTELLDYTFHHCTALSSVLIPESVTSIAANAFNDCSPDLIIYGKRGSHAHLFAIENNIRFRSLE